MGSQHVAGRRPLGRKRSQWHREAAALPSEEGNPLLRRLAGLGTSELSLFALSDFDSAFERQARVKRLVSARAADDGGDGGEPRQQRPLTCAPRVQFLELVQTLGGESGDESSGESGDGSPRSQQHAPRGMRRSAAGPDQPAPEALDDFQASVSDSGDDCPRLPPPPPLEAPPPTSADKRRRCRTLLTLQALTGAGDPQHEVADSFCDTNWRHCAADFTRARSAPYPHNLRLHPILADSIRRRIVSGRRLFDTVTFVGLSRLDRRSPSLAKTRHDRVQDWLRDTAAAESRQ